jgi:glycosyltransferase involved in cell wall biosynthesis
VLHVIDSLRLGGAEALLAALLRELRASGRAWNAVCVPQVADADEGLVRDVRESADWFRWLPSAPLHRPDLFRAIGRALLDSRVDLVHSHLSTANIASRPVSVALRRPHLATIHTVPGPTAEDSRLRARADGWSSWLSRRLVAPSQEVADAYRHAFHLPEGRMRVIPNVPAAQPAPPDFDGAALRREIGGGNVEHLVLSVARLQPAKGIDDLVAATARLREQLPGLQVAVAGSGPQEEELRAQIERVGLSDSFRLLGARSDIGSLLAAADAFCLPSRHEGLPISLLEAMQAGLPCVATRVGGIPGLVNDGAEALLVDPANADGLAEALGRVLGDRELAARLGERGRALVRRRYDVAAAASSYADIYDELAGSKAPGRGRGG